MKDKFNKERELGFYWVVYWNTLCIAEYLGHGLWTPFGSENEVPERSFDKIHETRILPPNE